MGATNSYLGEGIRIRVRRPSGGIPAFFNSAQLISAEQNPHSDNHEGEPEPVGSWASLFSCYYESGTKRLLRFSVYNDRDEHVLEGSVYQDIYIGPESEILLYCIDQRSGNTMIIRRQYLVDFEVLRNVFR